MQPRDRYSKKPASPKQILAIRKLWARIEQSDEPARWKRRMATFTYGAFLRSVRYDSICEHLGVAWLGMWVGILPDGSTHT